MKKKILAVLICALMILCLLPTAAFAAEVAPTVDPRILAAAAAYEYTGETAYTYHGRIDAIDDVVRYRISASDWDALTGEGDGTEEAGYDRGIALIDDLARFLGALWRFDEGESIETLTYDDIIYRWAESGTLKGSNWAHNNDMEQTLVKAIRLGFQTKAPEFCEGFAYSYDGIIENNYYTAIALSLIANGEEYLYLDIAIVPDWYFDEQPAGKLFVGGEEVTPANADDIFGDKTAWFDAETDTLYLRNARISTTNVCGIESWLPELNIVVLPGTVSFIKTTATADINDEEDEDEWTDGIWGLGNLSISGGGKLVIETVDETDPDDFIEGTDSPDNYGDAICAEDGNVILKGIVLDVNAATCDGLSSLTYGPLFGYVVAYDSWLNIKAGDNGIDADSVVYCNNCTVSIDAGYDGILAIMEGVLFEDCFAVSITSGDDGIDVDGGVDTVADFIDCGTICINAEDCGINADGDTVVIDGCRTLNITSGDDGIIGKLIEIAGCDTVRIDSGEDGIDAGSQLAIVDCASVDITASDDENDDDEHWNHGIEIDGTLPYGVSNDAETESVLAIWTSDVRVTSLDGDAIYCGSGTVAGTILSNLSVNGVRYGIKVADDAFYAAPIYPIITTEGDPGSEPTIRIRGTGSLNGAEPLVLVDGLHPYARIMSGFIGTPVMNFIDTVPTTERIVGSSIGTPIGTGIADLVSGRYVAPLMAKLYPDIYLTNDYFAPVYAQGTGSAIPAHGDVQSAATGIPGAAWSWALIAGARPLQPAYPVTGIFGASNSENKGGVLFLESNVAIAGGEAAIYAPKANIYASEISAFTDTDFAGESCEDWDFEENTFQAASGDPIKLLVVDDVCALVDTLFENGEYELLLNGEEMGLYRFAELEDGCWTIQIADDSNDPAPKYLAVENGRLTESETAFHWNYTDGRFSCTTAYTTPLGRNPLFNFFFGFFFNRNVTYYLTAGEDGEPTVSTMAYGAKASFVDPDSEDEHIYTYKPLNNGTHLAVCEDCGKTWKQTCCFGEDGYCACGAFNPSARRVALEVKVDTDPTVVYGWFWIPYTYYKATIKVTEAKPAVVRTEYSFDGWIWYTGETVISYKKIDHLWIRITDETGKKNVIELKDIGKSKK